MVIYLAVFGSLATGWHITQRIPHLSFLPVAEAIIAQPDSTPLDCQIGDSVENPLFRVCTDTHPVNGMPQVLDASGFVIHGAEQTLVIRLDGIVRLLRQQAHLPLQLHDPPPKQPPRSL